MLLIFLVLVLKKRFLVENCYLLKNNIYIYVYLVKFSILIFLLLLMLVDLVDKDDVL